MDLGNSLVPDVTITLVVVQVTQIVMALVADTNMAQAVA